MTKLSFYCKSTIAIIALTLFNVNLNAQIGTAKVISYCPAPGQFINILPEYINGADSATITEQANEYINQRSLISLGGFGGYVIIKFDNAVNNTTNQYNFSVFGNAFSNSSEPGIVMVSKDENKNGLADDTWFELAGSEYPNCTKNYSITYYRPNTETESPLNEYIRWEDNNGQMGYISKINIHTQSYYPLWVNADSITFHGTLLPSNSVDKNGDGTFFEFNPYAWGYADNHLNNQLDKTSFKIDWAVNNNGDSVYLDEINFVKIYTAVNHSNGHTGESSTEFAGVKNLTPVTTNNENINQEKVVCFTLNKQIIIQSSNNYDYSIFSTSGTFISKGYTNTSTYISTQNLNNGVYVIILQNDKETITKKLII